METENPKFKATLDSLLKKTITNVITSEEDAIIVLDFGESNSLFIHCAWRFSRYDKIISTWNDMVLGEDELDEETTPPPPAIKKMEGLTLDKIEMGSFYDLKITLGKGYQLDVFCDLHSHDEISDFDENWSVSDVDNNICFVVTENFKLIETKYNTEVPI